jgi:hypothetical protein
MKPLATSFLAASAIIGSSMLAGRALAALPQFSLNMPPTAPILRSPAAGATIEVNYNDAIPTFVWRHGGLYYGYPRPAAPTHFAICMYDVAMPVTCSWATSSWQAAVGSIPSVPASPISGGTPGQYDYTYQLPTAVSSTLLDRQVRWSVGACVVGSTVTCTFSTPADLWLSTKNIVGKSISTSSSVGRNLYFEGTVENPGTTSIDGPVKTVVDIYNTLMTAGETCLKDPNDAMVQPTDQVITATGRIVSVSALTVNAQGMRVPPSEGVAGIYRAALWHSPSFLAISGTIPGRGWNPRDPTAPGSASVFAFALQVSSNQPVPAAYTAVMQPDYFNDKREYNESDNNKAQCHVIH